jgi:hypothetical protein
MPLRVAGWKYEVAAALPRRQVDPAARFELQIGYVVHPIRNWVALWKPIDALGGILGEDIRQWAPHDQRAFQVGLHRRCDADLPRHYVAIRISWRRL